MRPPAPRSARPAVVRAAAALGMLAVLGLSGCGGEGITLPTALPSASGLPSSLPSVSLPERTRTPSPTQSSPEASAAPTSEAPSETPTSATPTPEPTVTEQPAETPTPEESSSDVVALPPSSESPTSESPTPTEEPTSESPTPTPSETAEPSASEPSPSETASSSPPVAGTPTATPAGGDEGSSLPIWIPIVAILGLAGAAILLLIGRSKARRWDEQFEVESAQAQWVRRELLPAMTNPATPLESLATHWAGAQPTLDQLHEGLATVVASAPDAARQSRAQALADAVSEVRQALAADLALRGSGQVDPAALASSAARVAASRDRLAAALASVA
jgi:hypothetical protein